MTLDEAVAIIEPGQHLKLEPCSCRCGECRYAWLKQRPSGAFEMVGCLGHTRLVVGADLRLTESVEPR